MHFGHQSLALIDDGSAWGLPRFRWVSQDAAETPGSH
jgi:hypothetical protein